MSAQAKPPVMMRINIAGFQGEPATLFGAYAPDTDMLAIVKIAKGYEGGARDGFLKITNQSRDASYDAVFTEEETRDAIMAYFNLDSLKLLTLKGEATRCNPGNKIERDGMDDTGLKFSFHPEITNQQVAVLAACLFANRQRAVSQMADFAADFNAITI